MFRSLRTKLVLSHLLVIVVGMTLSGVLLLTFAERYLLDATAESLMTQAYVVARALVPGAVPAASAANVSQATNAMQQATNLYVQQSTVHKSQSPERATAMQKSNLAHLSDVSVRLSSDLPTRIRVLDERGLVLVDSQNGTDEGLNRAMEPGVAVALTGEQTTCTHDGVMHVAVPLFHEDRVAGVVCVSQPLHDTLAVLDGLRWLLLLSTAVGVLAAGLVGLVLARAMSNPLRELATAAAHLARGEFDWSLHIRSRDEIGQLGDSFRRMGAQLQRTLDDLAQQNERLCELEDLKTRFVSDVSHELRTPLTSIKGMVETLRAGAVDDVQVRDRFLGTIEAETDRLAALVNDLLVLSRADSHVLELRLDAVDITALVRESVERLAPQATSKGVRVEVVASAGPAVARVDPYRIQQVLVNLLDNAIKYSPAGGVVTVSVAPSPDGGLCVAVRDEGPGIPPEDQPHVFERFYRAGGSRKGRGAGLGLSIAQALVEAHGGHISLESVVGKGTTVSFVAPSTASSGRCTLSNRPLTVTPWSRC